MYQVDIRDGRAVGALVAEWRPDVVYLPASLTNVDYCELHPDEAYEINVAGVCNVVRATKDVGAGLVYLSSDYVFDGSCGPYAEGDPARPICVYGWQKLLGEHYIALHASRFLVVRTTVVYGWESQGKNFIQRLVESLRKGDRVQVPLDQVGSPTYGPNLAEAIVELVEKGCQGLFHVVGPKLVSRYDLAVAAAGAFGLDPAMVVPVSTRDLGQAAPRPLNAGMVVDKAHSVLETRLKDYVEGLAMMAREQAGRSAAHD
jgi:dTDP-4-dehydrorhamnose reductase